MKFTVSSTLLDACVLAVLSVESTYGYDLTQKIQNTLGVSESTLYPVLRRLQKNGLLETFDVPVDGRNRRYYKMTALGKTNLEEYILDWQDYKTNIDQLLMREFSDE